MFVLIVSYKQETSRLSVTDVLTLAQNGFKHNKELHEIGNYFSRDSNAHYSSSTH
jgi:hypothetical protein